MEVTPKIQDQLNQLHDKFEAINQNKKLLCFLHQHK